MGRYACKQGKEVNVGKAFNYCLPHRCPDLQVNMYVRGKIITNSVVPPRLCDMDGRCKGDS